MDILDHMAKDLAFRIACRVVPIAIDWSPDSATTDHKIPEKFSPGRGRQAWPGGARAFFSLFNISLLLLFPFFLLLSDSRSASSPPLYPFLVFSLFPPYSQRTLVSTLLVPAFLIICVFFLHISASPACFTSSKPTTNTIITVWRFYMPWTGRVGCPLPVPN